MTTAARSTTARKGTGALFAMPHWWADMDSWHEEVAQIRRANRVLPVELAGPPQWSESAFVSGVKHLPVRYSFR